MRCIEFTAILIFSKFRIFVCLVRSKWDKKAFLFFYVFHRFQSFIIVYTHMRNLQKILLIPIAQWLVVRVTGVVTAVDPLPDVSDSILNGSSFFLEKSSSKRVFSKILQKSSKNPIRYFSGTQTLKYPVAMSTTEVSF